MMVPQPLCHIGPGLIKTSERLETCTNCVDSSDHGCALTKDQAGVQSADIVYPAAVHVPMGVGPAAGCDERRAAPILRHKTSTTADPILSHFNSNSELSTGWERNRALHFSCRCDLGVASAYEAVRDTLSTRKRGLPGGVGDNLAMDALQIELAKLRRDANLTQSIHDVDKIIKQLENARESIVSGMEAFLSSLRWGAKSAEFDRSIPAFACILLWHSCLHCISLADPNSASITLAKLQNPLKSGFDKVNDDLKKIHKGHSNYGKALDKVCRWPDDPFALC
jgi:hypothetical protein